MISLIILPDKIVIPDNSSVVFKFEINDLQNNIYYYGQVLNITLQKVGYTGLEVLYPQRYNKEPIIWHFTPDQTGTFIVNTIVQNETNNIIVSNTFIVEAETIYGKVNTSNNINNFIPKNNITRQSYPSEEDYLIAYNKTKVDTSNLFNKI